MRQSVEDVMQQVVAEPLRAARPVDADLVLDARAGDRAAFDELVGRRLEGTFRTVMAILGHEADARDVTQEIFVRVWRDLEALRDPSRFEAWFGRIVVNTSRTALRRRGRIRVREIAAELSDDEQRAPARAVSTGFEEQTADLDVVERAFARLGVDDRTLLVLHHLDHRSISLIAAMLGIPDGTAKSRLHHARRALERALEVERR